MIDDASTPWWAVALLDLSDDDDLSLLRTRRQLEVDPRTGNHWPLGGADREGWAAIVDRAVALARRTPIEKWIQKCYDELDHDDLFSEGGEVTRAVRHACCTSVRALSQFLDLRDDDGDPFIFDRFHVETVSALRRYPRSEALLPFATGKSVLSNIVVPLMDWAEWPQCTQARIYHDESHITKWVNRLLQIVQDNERLHMIFPWIDKPKKGDACYGLWGVEGFSIRGKTVRQRSFEVMTIGAGRTGLRHHRIVVDDVVISKDAGSLPVQDRYYDYLTTGVFTTKQRTTHRSPYGTHFPSVSIVGTLFSAFDVNARMWKYFGEKGWKRIRFDIYPQGREKARSEGIVLWPSVLPFDKCRELEVELGMRAFNMRCRNLISGAEKVKFSEKDFARALQPLLQYGVPPQDARGLIAFDPGSGKITKYSANPAFMVYYERPRLAPNYPVPAPDDPWRDRSEDWLAARRAEQQANDVLVHLVEWERLEGVNFPDQCHRLVELVQRYHVPLAFEDNAIQTAYRDYIEERYPGQVEFIAHTTNVNKNADDGLETYAPLFENGMVLIHYGGAPAENVAQLKEEFTLYGQGGRYSDLLMAAWIAKFQAKKRRPTYSLVSVDSAMSIPVGGRWGGAGPWRTITL